jgi:triacylglycerol lipase
VGIDEGIREVLAGVPLHLFRNGEDLVTEVPPGGYHPADLLPIGVAAFPFPNLTDHAIERVILALSEVSNG